MLLRPEAAAAHLPDVNEIAHDIKHLEIVFAQEIEQSGSTARTRSQMDIGNPGGPHPDCSFPSRVKCFELETWRSDRIHKVGKRYKARSASSKNSFVKIV